MLNQIKKIKNIYIKTSVLMFFLFLSLHAGIASAPLVSSLHADNVLKTSATLNGEIDDKIIFSVDSVGFEFGLDTNYGQNISGVFNGDYSYGGSIGSLGAGNGQFNQPAMVAIDSNNNIYVADTSNNRIQKFDSNGTYVSQFGTPGTGDGQFNNPAGIAIDSNNNIYVADISNSRIQKFDSNGTYVSQFGTPGTGDGQFAGVIGIAIDSDNNIFTSEILGARIQKFDSNGTYVSQFGTSGTGDGQFDGPRGIAIDSSNNIFVADSNNSRIQKFDSNGTYVSQFGTSGTGDGQFNNPVGITIDSSNNIYVTDTNNSRIQKFDSNGVYISQFGTFGTGDGQFNSPTAVAIDSSNNIFVVDRSNNRIQKFIKKSFSAPVTSLACDTTYHYRAFATNDEGTSYGNDETFITQYCSPLNVFTKNPANITTNSANLLGVHTGNGAMGVNNRGFEYGIDTNYGTTIDETGSLFVNKFGTPGTGDGQFDNPVGITIDSSNNIFVVDNANNRIQKFDSNGVYISQFGALGNGDGQFDNPWFLAIGSSNNIFVVDSANNRIQKFDSNGTYVSQFGTSGTGDGQFDNPVGITIDSSNNIYVTDTNNSRIQKFDSNGVYISQFGTPGTGDGQFNSPAGIAIDSNNNTFVADSGNNRIQKFDSNGTYVSQFGTPGTGDGQFNLVAGIFIDSDNNIFTSEILGARIQKFDSDGNYISQFGLEGSGDGQFSYPFGINIDSSNNIYVADSGNIRIQIFNENFSLPITGLICETTYHYRAFVTNIDITSYGNDKTFTTSSCGSTPPVVTGGGGTTTDGPVKGCTDESAVNFNRRARADDGSCLYSGCMDSSAINYDSNADYEDGSCKYAPVTPVVVEPVTPPVIPPTPPVTPPTPPITPPSIPVTPPITPPTAPIDPIIPVTPPTIFTENPISPTTPINNLPPAEKSNIMDDFITIITEIPKEILAMVAIGSIVASIILTGVLQPGLLSAPFLFLNMVPTLVGLKRKKRPWGTVYDSVTKQPLDPAYVSLKNKDRVEMASAITDIDGRYGFLINPGVYNIEVSKKDYIFPSQKLSDKNKDELYNNLYMGGDIEIESKESVVFKNIPMDPLNFNWNEFAKASNKKLMKFYSKRDVFLANISAVLFVVGTIASVILTTINPNTLNIIVLSLYGVIIILRIFGIKPKQAGYVKDKKGFPLSFGIIRIFSKALKQEVAHTVIGKTGKYYLLIANGNYSITISKKTGEDSYENVFQDDIRVKGGVIRKKFII